MSLFDDEPGGGRLNPADCLDHLLMVWAVGYIDHSPTKYSVPGKNSDVVVVDVVDLDQADADGYQGLVVRSAWWRNARLIGLLKGRIGRPKPILGWMGLGVATMGKPPYELHYAVEDPVAVGRAQAWMEAHPDFRPTAPQGHNPEAERIPAQQPVQREPSYLEQLAAQSVNPERRDPHAHASLRQLVDDVRAQAVPVPLPPPRPPQDDIAPF
jgi:hypothetical protein